MSIPVKVSIPYNAPQQLLEERLYRGTSRDAHHALRLQDIFRQQFVTPIDCCILWRRPHPLQTPEFKVVSHACNSTSVKAPALLRLS